MGDTNKNVLLILVVVLVMGIIAFCVGITNPNDANKALDAMGFTEVQITGYKWFACSRDDWYHTGFKAVNQNKKAVSGTVCSGLIMKNSTVRFD